MKNPTQFKLPVPGASNENEAIRLLDSLNIDAMMIRAYAVKGRGTSRTSLWCSVLSASA